MYLLFYIGYNVPYNILVTMYLIFCISYNVPYNILVTMYLINVNLCTYTKGYPAKGVQSTAINLRDTAFTRSVNFCSVKARYFDFNERVEKVLHITLNSRLNAQALRELSFFPPNRVPETFLAD